MLTLVSKSWNPLKDQSSLAYHNFTYNLQYSGHFAIQVLMHPNHHFIQRSCWPYTLICLLHYVYQEALHIRINITSSPTVVQELKFSSLSSFFFLVLFSFPVLYT